MIHKCGGVWSVALLQSRGGAAVSGGSVTKVGRAAGTNLFAMLSLFY